MGILDLQIPQVRGSDFYPSCLERGSRTDRSLLMAIIEMYVNGVSTRKVAKITEELCGFEVSSSAVSAATAKLDGELQAWCNRALSQISYLILDARYEKVREGGVVRDCAVLVAIGIDPEGKRQILGVSVALSEHEAHWRNFLSSLLARGLHGVKLVISDAHAGLQKALTAVLPSVPWQRCQFHLQQNAIAYSTSLAQRKAVAQGLRTVFAAPDAADAQRYLKAMVDKYATQNPKLASWLEESIPQGLTIFQFPEKYRRRLRTTNCLERLNREIKRRTNVVKIFPNIASCHRLVAALLSEISEEWLTGRVYLGSDTPA